MDICTNSTASRAGDTEEDLRPSLSGRTAGGRSCILHFLTSHPMVFPFGDSLEAPPFKVDPIQPIVYIRLGKDGRVHIYKVLIK